MEMEAMKKLSSPLPGPLAKETFDAFSRYEEQREGDAEARVAKDLDKYDMILQGHISVERILAQLWQEQDGNPI